MSKPHFGTVSHIESVNGIWLFLFSPIARKITNNLPDPSIELAEFISKQVIERINWMELKQEMIRTKGESSAFVRCRTKLFL